MEHNILEIDHLHVVFPSSKGETSPVNDVSLRVPAGKIVGIVGESGCGKSMTARAVMGLIHAPGRITEGEIRLCGRDLRKLSEKEYCSLRGSEVSMIFQEPMTSLNPVMKAGHQVEEVLRLHTDIPESELKQRVIDIFRAVGITEPEKRYNCYPHELSGGLRQRVIIAMAMICRPRLMIADEPTTALDVTVQAQILRLMKDLVSDDTGLLVISHDLGVIAKLCDYVYVMYAGRIVEESDIFTLFDDPQHPYTKGLMDAVGSLRRDAEVLSTIPGVVPSLAHLPAGCSFCLRCENGSDRCEKELPGLIQTGPGHKVRCHLMKEAGQ